MRIIQQLKLPGLVSSLALALLLPIGAHAGPSADPVDAQMMLDPGTPNPVFSGEGVSWQLRVVNADAGPAAAISPGELSVNLNLSSQPAGVTFNAVGMDWNCGSTSCTYQSGIESGETSSDLSIQGLAPTTATPGTIGLTTQLAITSTNIIDINSANDGASDQVSIDPELVPDFFIQSLDATPDPVAGGGNVTYTLRAGVAGTKKRPARGFSFALDYVLSSAPGGASLMATPSGTNWNCDSLSCSYSAEIPPGQLSNPLTFVATAQSQSGTMTLDALITTDATPANNAAQRVVTVTAPNNDDFLISSISGAPNPIDPGASGTFEVQVERFGDKTVIGERRGLPGPELTFNLSSTPGGAVIIGQPSGSGWSCLSGVCQYNPFLPSNTPSPPLVFNVQAPPNGPGDMTLDVLLANDDNNGNNAGSASISVNGSGQLDYSFATFAGAPSPALIGSVVEFQVAVRQAGSGGGGGGTGTDGTISVGGLRFEYDLSSTPGSPQLIGTPSGSNWACTAVDCAFTGSLSDGQTTPPVVFTVRAPNQGPGSLTLQGTLFGDQVSNNNSGSDTVSIIVEDVAPVELTLDKSAPATAQTDEDILYTLTVSNVGEPAATQLSLSDTLPNGMTLVGVDAGDWFCNANASTVNCSRDVLGSGQQTQVGITVRASAPGDYLNQAKLTAADVPIALSDTALTRIDEVQEPFVDLMLTKSDSVDPVAPGAPFSYTLTVTNLGNLAATGVTITENFPPGMVVVGASGSNWSCSASNLCQLGFSLLGGQSSVLRLDVLAPPSAGTITNRAQVTSLEFDSRPQDNEADEQTMVVGAAPSADLQVQAVAASPSIEQGQTREIDVTVSNNGPDEALTPNLTGSVSGAISLVSAAGPGVNCSISGSTFDCPLATLQPDQSVVLKAVVRGSADSGSGSADFQVTSPTPDPQVGNNADQVQFSLIALGADLAVDLSDSADPTSRGGSFDYRLQLANAGPLPVEQATLSITLDPSVVVGSQSTPGLSCTPALSTTQTCTLSSTLGNSSVLEATFSVRVPLAAADSLSASATVSSPVTDPNPLNNSDSESTAVGAADEDAIRDGLNDSAGDDPIAGPAVGPTAERCANPDGGFIDLCEQLLVAPDDEVRETLAALAPEENLAQATVLRELSFAQFFNVDARLAELRGAGGGFSTAGLNLSTRTGSLGFDQLSQMLGEERQSDDAGGLFSSPWGFFVNGTISSGDQSFDGTSGQVGVDFESRGLTAGVDYRFSTSLVVGAAIGYANFDSDVTGDSELDTTGYTITGYGSWYPRDSFYLDGRISIGQVEMDQARRVRFTLNGQTTDVVARGSADADQLSLAFGAGYHLNRGAWNFTPNASLRYTNSDVDGFTERGAGDFALTYDSTSTDSLLVSAGLQMSRAFSLSRGVVTPQLSLSWNFEDRGDELAVTGRFASTNGNQAFRFVSPETDSNYGALGLGLVFVGANGVQAYVNYRTVFGYDDFSRDTLNLGARFEF